MARVEPYILAYDIADPKRLKKVHKQLKKWGIPLQYSVFTLDLSERSAKTLMAILERMTDSEHDDVRLYRMPQGQGEWIGPSPIGEGIILTGVKSTDMVRSMMKRGMGTPSEE